MNARSLAALVLLNVVLLAALVVTALSPQPAEAQLVGGGQYTMIAGQATGRQGQDVIYIVNLRTSQMAAVLFNSSNNTFQVIDGRVIGQDVGSPTRSPR